MKKGERVRWYVVTLGNGAGNLYGVAFPGNGFVYEVTP